MTYVVSQPYGASMMFAAHQAAQWNNQRSIETIQTAMKRQRLMLPPHAVLAQLVQEVAQTPPPEDELRLLAEVVEEAQEQNLGPEQIKTRLSGTRIWQLVKVIAMNDVRIATDLMLLLMILDTLMRFFPAPPPPQPAPQVTVNLTVNVDAGEVADQVAKRLEDEGICVVPEPDAKGKPKPHK